MKKLEWLEAMRGVAALWVLLHHAVLAARDFAGLSGSGWRIAANGYLGVDFFFVLSGFIIATSAQALVDSGRGIREYATARALRIYVPYLPIGVAMLLAYIALPGLSQGTRYELSVLSSLTLLPSNAPPALSVAWTLVHEVIFYAVYSLFFLSRRALAAVLAVWVVAMLMAWAAAAKLSPLGAYFLGPVNLCFVLGVALAWSTRRGVSNVLGAALGASGVLLVASQALTMNPSGPLVALGFAGMVVAARAPFLLERSPGRVLLTLGTASYSVYLVHNPAVSLFARVVHGSPTAVFFQVAGGALLAGLAYHFLYERPALRWARRHTAPQVSLTGVSSSKGTIPASPSS